MKNHKFPAILTVIIMIQPLMFARETSRPLNLEECIQTVLKQNPLLLSSWEQYRASLARIYQARALSQPSLDYDSDLQPKAFQFRQTGETYFGLSQSLEFPGKRRLRGKIAGQESKEILQDIELLKLDLIFQVKQAFYGILLAQEKLIYARQNLELSEDFLQKAQFKFETGDVARVEVLRAKVESSKAANEVRQAENDVRLAKAALNFLLARKKYSSLEIEGELPADPVSSDLEELTRKALAFRPELHRVQNSLQIEILKKKQGQMSYLPDFELGLSKHWIEGEGSFWDVTFSIPIPLFFWQAKKGEIAEAEAAYSGLKREEEHLRNTVILEVEEAYRNAVTADNQIKLFEDEILAQAEEVYNMFLFSYQEGEIGGIELIEARKTLVESRMSYADALYNHAVGLSLLDKAVGTQPKGENK
jgi:outer membrane protein TolC